MNLTKSRAEAHEQIVGLIKRGRQVVHEMRADYDAKMSTKSYDRDSDLTLYQYRRSKFTGEAITVLNSIFPTEREAIRFTTYPKDFPIRARFIDNVEVCHVAMVFEDLDASLYNLAAIVEENLKPYPESLTRGAS